MVQNVEAFCSTLPSSASTPPPLWTCFLSLKVTCLQNHSLHSRTQIPAEILKKSLLRPRNRWKEVGPQDCTINAPTPKGVLNPSALPPNTHFLPQETHGLYLAYLPEFPGWHDVQMTGDQKPLHTASTVEAASGVLTCCILSHQEKLGQ